MESLDPVAQGRVQILGCPAGNDAQALAAVNEMIRLSKLIPDWSWKGTAIISRDWRKLLPVCDFAEAHGIPVEMANENLPSVWRTREMRRFIGGLGFQKILYIKKQSDCRSRCCNVECDFPPCHLGAPLIDKFLFSPGAVTI